MEDAHSCVVDLEGAELASFFGVFDGHGGSAVAKYCGLHMPEVLVQTEAYKNRDYAKSLEDAFLKVDDAIATEKGVAELTALAGGSSQVKPEGIGCTAVCALIQDNKLYVANSGDSRCVLSRESKQVEMSFDHKPMNKTEHDRITKAGGFVQQGRVNGSLNLSRAIGDRDYKLNSSLKPHEQIITCVPDVKIRELTPGDEFIILACDGVWDILTNEEAVAFVSQWLKDHPGQPLSGACEAVLDRCLAPDPSNGLGCDNMTCIIVQLDWLNGASPTQTTPTTPANDATPNGADSTVPSANTTNGTSI